MCEWQQMGIAGASMAVLVYRARFNMVKATN